VIVGEFKLVLPLDPGKLGVGQARPDLASSYLSEPASGPLTQSAPFAADHSRTITPCSGCDRCITTCRDFMKELAS